MFSKVAITLDDREEDPQRVQLMHKQIQKLLVENYPELVNEAWKKSREFRLRQLNIIDLNMRYDLNTYCKES